jgi:hypothetical protein
MYTGICIGYNDLGLMAVTGQIAAIVGLGKLD